MKISLVFLLIVHVHAATVSVCQSGCTTTSLQSALDTIANCGDTIQIKSTETQTGNFRITDRGCTSGTPITVSSDRPAWLPLANTRITPSHLANMAILRTPNAFPALCAVTSGGAGPPAAGNPPSHWIFRGIGFKADNAGSITFGPVDMGGLCYTPVNSSQIASDITFDQCFFFVTLPNGAASGEVQNWLRLNCTSCTVKNSYFGDGISYGGVETHAIAMLTTTGPVEINNNYIVTASIPVFTGGAVPDTPGVPTNIAVRYNNFYRPWKWLGDQASPFFADYVANAATAREQYSNSISSISGTGLITFGGGPIMRNRAIFTIAGASGSTPPNGTGFYGHIVGGSTWQIDGQLVGAGLVAGYPYSSATGGTAKDTATSPCMKNLGEFKFGDQITYQHNVGENSWRWQEWCQNQFTGFTATTRTSWDASSWGNFTLSDTTHAVWSASITYPTLGLPTNDSGLCLPITSVGYQCRPITAANNGTKTFTVSPPFSSSSLINGTGYVTYDASEKLTNLTVVNNVFKSAAAGVNILALSPNNGQGTAGFGTNHILSNNLFATGPSDKYTTCGRYINGAAGEISYSFNPTNYTYDHNTWYCPNGSAGEWVFISGIPALAGVTIPKFSNFTLTNQLTGPITSAPFPFKGDSADDISQAINAYFTGSTLKNNVFPGAVAGSGCTGATCSGNILTAWADPFGGLAPSGILKVLPGRTYAKAASDNLDIGASFDRLPLVTGVKVTASQQAALLEFDLSTPIRDAGASQPCVLEVSANRNLHSDLGTYAVIADLNPAFFFQPDTSARGNSRLLPVTIAGVHVLWPIGQNASVVGDDAVSHDLRLVPGTTYYGRVMCYGDSQLFSFRTSASANTSLRFPASWLMTISTRSGTTTVRLEFGPLASLGSSADFAVGAGGVANVSIPMLQGGLTYYRLRFLSGAQVIYTGPVQSRLAQQ